MLNLFNKLSDNIIIINTKGQIRFLDNKLLSKLGYDKCESLGKSSISLFRDNNIDCQILNCKEDKSLEKFAFNIYSKYNEIFNYEGILSLENYNGEEVIFIICNEVKEELYSKKDLENFIDETPFMCTLKDLNGKYLFANKLFSQAIEERKENIIGKYDKDIFSSKTAKKLLLEENHIITTKETLTTEKYIKKENGFNRWCKVHKFPILNEVGEVIYIASASYDVSLRKNIETKLDTSFENTLLSNNNDIIETYNRLDNIQNILVKELNADGFSVWIYNENNKEIVSEFSHGISYHILGEKSRVKFDSSEFTKHALNADFEGIRPVNEITGLSPIDLVKYEIKYRGIYKISFNNKVIGLLSVLYKDIEPDYSKEDYIKKYVMKWEC